MKALLASMLLVPLVVPLLAACGHTVTPVTAATPIGPSAQAKLVCGDEAAGDIAEALGVPTSQAPLATWENQLYSCRYAYPSGVFTVSVKDLANAGAATSYFIAEQTRTAGAQTLPGVGQGAFVVPDGSTVVRKDAQVMTVDVGGLPARFGVPPHPRQINAITVANVILACWTES